MFHEGKIRKFSDTRCFQIDTKSLKMEILTTDYVALGKMLLSFLWLQQLWTIIAGKDVMVER